MHNHGLSLFQSFIRNEDKVNSISTLPFIDTNFRVLQIPHYVQSFLVSVQVTARLTAHTDDITQQVNRTTTKQSSTDPKA
jgi:hypothetical protein